MDLSKSESHSFYYYSTYFNNKSLFICFITHEGVNHLKNGNFGLLIMYHFILAVAAEDDDHFLFKSNSFTIKYVTKQLSSQEGQHNSKNRIFFYNISDDAEVWETHAFKSTIINCREL